MGREIERKFLVSGDAWRNGNGIPIRQGYLLNKIDGVIRVRTKGEKAYLTIKGGTTGFTRLEFEYEIPVDDASEMLETLCQKPLIEKMRYAVKFDGITWEVDEFLKENAGLVLAEVELESEDQPFVKPDWIGLEVSTDPRYYNANLVNEPFTKWKTG